MVKCTRRAGVSAEVKLSIGGGRFNLRGYSSETLGFKKLKEKEKKDRDRYNTAIEGLSHDNVQVLHDISGTLGASMHDGAFDNGYEYGLLAGDVEMGGSDDNEGGRRQTTDANVESIMVDMRDLLGLDRWHGVCRYKDSRTWKQRIRRVHERWAPLLDAVTTAYIRWRYGARPDVLSSTDPDFTPSTNEHDFILNVADIYTLPRAAVIPRAPDEDTVVAIAHAGYLATSPDSPSFAVSFQTLELFRVICLFKVSFSIEAFAKVLCHQYSIPYRRGYRTAVSDTFDIYLAIQRLVDARVSAELGYDTPNHRVLHSCPACTYEVQDEPQLRFSRMWVIDGNNSLKRMKGFVGRQVADTRVFGESDYFLSMEYVNRFANEVKARSTPRATEPDSDSDDDDDKGEGGDPTDGQVDEQPDHCTTNWKAAAADGKKRMWEAFDEAGIFASACRHGLVLWLTDMIRSGELAKYPLAMVAKALEVFPSNWLVGYDIGCSFGATIANSSLGPTFAQKQCRTCVNAFHGYTHSAECQRKHHPLNIEGMGLEDLETLECVFSLSNSLASWDREKYQNLSTMLHNNYVQALDIIEDEGRVLKDDLATLGLTEENLEGYFADEARHMEMLGTETQRDLHAVAYVELLQKLRDCKAAYENVTGAFHLHLPSDYQFLVSETSYAHGTSETRKLETRRKYLGAQLDMTMFEVTKMEVAMGIDRHWEPSSPEYKQALEYMNRQKYQRALEHLHKLVVFRLFELHKMNLSNTGYKLCTHLSHALQRRSKAIWKAVSAYNKAALAIGRDTLDWSKVSHFSFLNQFDILRDTRHDVTQKPWASPVVRVLMKTHRRVARAREEIQCLNVELRRLHTSIVDEDKLFDVVLCRLQNSSMFGPVSDYVDRRHAVNVLHLQRMQQTYALPGFSGTPGPGVKSVSTPDVSSSELNTPNASDGPPPLESFNVDPNMQSSLLGPSTNTPTIDPLNSPPLESISHSFSTVSATLSPSPPPPSVPSEHPSANDIGSVPFRIPPDTAPSFVIPRESGGSMEMSVAGNDFTPPPLSTSIAHLLTPCSSYESHPLHLDDTMQTQTITLCNGNLSNPGSAKTVPDPSHQTHESHLLGSKSSQHDNSTTSVPLRSPPTFTIGDEDGLEAEEEDDSNDDEFTRGAGQLVDFMTNLAL